MQRRHDRSSPRPERSSWRRLPLGDLPTNLSRITSDRRKDAPAITQFDRRHPVGRLQEIVQHERRRWHARPVMGQPDRCQSGALALAEAELDAPTVSRNSMPSTR
jgi:hypothetical protein